MPVKKEYPKKTDPKPAEDAKPQEAKKDEKKKKWFTIYIIPFRIILYSYKF